MPSPVHYTYIAAWLALLPCVLHAGVQPFDLVLQPTDAFVHYNDEYIRAPGSIDLGGLTFTAISEVFGNDDALLVLDIEEMLLGDDVLSNKPVNSTMAPTSGAGGEDKDEAPRPRLDGGVESSGTFVDVAIFKLPAKWCVHTNSDCDLPGLGVGNRSEDGSLRWCCDWPGLGVGNRSEDGKLRWCCSPEALALGACEEEDYGRLMINKEKYVGNHRFFLVPDEGPMSKQIKYGKVEALESGTYVVLYANCNERGREIFVQGESVWKSEHGYLPGELYGFMYSYIFTTTTMLLWFL